MAEEIERSARSDPNWPDYLNDSAYAASVSAWARAEAVVSLLWAWLSEHAEQGVEELLAETSSEQSDETRAKGRTRRMTTGRRVASVLEQARKWESAAANHRTRLGLDPLSRARLGRDVAIGNAVSGQLDRLRETGAELVERYGGRALSASHQAASDHASTGESGGSNDHES